MSKLRAVQPIEIKFGDVRAVMTAINVRRRLWQVEIWRESAGRQNSNVHAYISPERCAQHIIDWAEATADATR